MQHRTKAIGLTKARNMKSWESSDAMIKEEAGHVEIPPRIQNVPYRKGIQKYHLGNRQEINVPV